jgi:hypothetical protein
LTYRSLKLFGVIIPGVAIYFGALAALGFRPQHFMRREQ